MRPIQNSDLSSAVPRCTVDQLHPRLLDALAVLRDWCDILDVPFHVNCAYRSRDWDLAKGRSGKSSHCKGLAVDLRAVNHNHRRLLVNALAHCGFQRIGIAKTFIHADLDDEKAPSMWLYSDVDLNKTF